MPPKRPIVKPSTSAAKRPRTVISSGITKSAASSSATAQQTTSQSNASNTNNQLREEFIALLSSSEHKRRGISNSALKTHFGDARYPQLVPIINELTRESRLNMSKMGEEVYFSLLSSEEATKLAGLDASSKMVYQVIEAAGNKGIWTVDIRVQTNIQQTTLTKIFKVRLFESYDHHSFSSSFSLLQEISHEYSTQQQILQPLLEKLYATNYINITS